MRAIFQWVGMWLLVFCGSAAAAAGAPAPCALEAAGLRIEARSEPDDGFWGPTVEVEVADALRPLSRLMAPESRPIEACWWTDIEGDGKPELVIGLGPEPDRHRPPGLLVYTWHEQRLTPGNVPGLPAGNAGSYRFVVRARSLWAFPIGSPLAADPRHAYRLEAGRWEVATPSKSASARAPAP